jgi:hypothetical protein
MAGWIIGAVLALVAWDFLRLKRKAINRPVANNEENPVEEIFGRAAVPPPIASAEPVSIFSLALAPVHIQDSCKNSSTVQEKSQRKSLPLRSLTESQWYCLDDADSDSIVYLRTPETEANPQRYWVTHHKRTIDSLVKHGMLIRIDEISYSITESGKFALVNLKFYERKNN